MSNALILKDGQSLGINSLDWTGFGVRRESRTVRLLCMRVVTGDGV